MRIINKIPLSVKIILVGWIIFKLFPQLVSGHGNGAPESRCDNMNPGHWVASQSTPAPYFITQDKSIVGEGDTVHINLTSTPDQAGFKGFLVMVRKPGGEQPENYGQFNIGGSEMIKSQPLSCFGKEASAMTHRDPVEKGVVFLEWVAPTLSTNKDFEDFQIRATFVQNFWTMWINVGSPQIIRVVKSKFQPEQQPPIVINATNSAINLANSANPNLSNPSSLPPHNSNFPNLVSNASPPPPPKMIRDRPSGQRQQNVPTAYGEGGWQHFKRTWLQILQYFGLGSDKKIYNQK